MNNCTKMEEYGWATAVELVEDAANMNVIRKFRNPLDCFELPVHQFKKIFRLDPTLVDKLIIKLEPFMDNRIRSSGLDVESRVNFSTICN